MIEEMKKHLLANVPILLMLDVSLCKMQLVDDVDWWVRIATRLLTP